MQIKKFMDKEIEIEGKRLKLTNLDIIFFPKENITKGDLIDYYSEIAEYILPYLKDRPQSLNRFPNGINGESFYQKNVETHPDWARTEKIWSEGNQDYINYIICNDKATLLYLINLGCIDLNVWNSRLGSLEYPDFLVIDLDPEDISFEKVVEVANEIKKLLQGLDVTSYVKTSGASGLHIQIPLGAKYSYEQIRDFAKILVMLVNKKLPDITSIERMPAKRQKRVYLDFLQNRMGSTMAAPFSVRPKPGATVSMPLDWSEVNRALTPQKFNIKNASQEIGKRINIFKPTLQEGTDIEKVLQKIDKI